MANARYEAINLRDMISALVELSLLLKGLWIGRYFCKHGT